MKKIKFLFILLLFLGVVYFLVIRLPKTPADKNDIKVLLVHRPMITEKFDYVSEAYKSVMEEEGVPFKYGNSSSLLSSQPVVIARQHPAIIFADGIARSLPTDMRFWIKEYLSQGGNVAIIYDAGTKDLRNNYRDKAIFSELLGLNYMVYNKLRDANDAYTSAYIRFKDKQGAAFFQVPPGKTDDKLFINGYSYGQLIFPIARVQRGKDLDERDVYAYGVTEAGDTYPVIVWRKVLSGNLLYVNLPLGHLKANSDDLMLRLILRAFLFKIAKTPHLVNTPDGKGGLVINWHIDWDEDWQGITFMKQNGYFTPHIRYSLHNTAGPFTDTPGDGRGFDACGKGRPYLQSILKYGILGSHGGWGHNWFYKNILSGNFQEKEIEKYILKNNQCLESISGYPVTEYSAPNGVHPQPLLTRILEKNGIIAYYYTGDSGSAPNRTFYRRKMISQNVIAFPVLSYRQTASFFEMNRDGVSKKDLYNWLNEVLAFLIENRTVRLIYSHCYDVPPYYPETLKRFIHNVEEKCREGKINAQPMSYFARFMHRFLKTRYRFCTAPNGLDIHLKNPEGLKGIVMAIPAGRYKKPDFNGRDIEIEEENGYYYLKLKENINEKTLHIDYAVH